MVVYYQNVFENLLEILIRKQMKKKKVLLTATVQSHICQFHRPLAEVLHAHGYEVHVAARDNLAEKNGLKLDFAEKIYNVPFSRSPRSPDNLRAYRELKKILEQERYDVIHCNTPMGGIVTRLAAMKARRKGTKVFYTAHGFHFYKGAPKKNWLVFYPIEKLFSRITDTLITITHEDHALASKKFHCRVTHMHGVGVDEKRYRVTSSQERAAVRQQLGLEKQQKVLLCVGELLPNKNQAMAIRMLDIVRKTFPDALLLLAGNGPQRENLERLTEELGLQEHVRFLGYCTELEIWQQAADILVSCSKREGLPLNIVEAMLSGNPVVATQNRGHRELVQPEENGYLVDVNDTEAMAQAVRSLLEDDEKRRKMGANAAIFAKQYGFENVKQALEGIYFGAI